MEVTSPPGSPAPRVPLGRLRRLSLAGGPSTSPGASPASPSASAASSNSLEHPSSRVHAPRPLRLSLVARQDSPDPSPISSPDGSETPTRDAPSPVSRPSPSPVRAAGHARRTSSISYSSSPSSLAFPRSPSAPASADRYRSPGSSLANVHENGSQSPPSTPSAAATFNSNRGSAAMGAEPTLSEIAPDLLSFIAKKERKCLDLREELKRHEDELQVLKKKWESLVAQSISTPTRKSGEHMRPYARHSVGGVPSPDPSAARQLAPHASDPNDPTSDESGGYSTAELELGESVQAAKKWLGGVMSKVVEAVAGPEESLTAPMPSAHLDSLREEDEPEEGGSTLKSSAMESSSRYSTASTLSIESLSSSLGFGASSRSTPLSSRQTSSSTNEPDLASLNPSQILPSSSSSSSIVNAYLYQSSEDEKSPSKARDPSAYARGSEGGHNRRRSTFDMLGSAAGGGWNSIGKRWTGITESETFKNSRRATLNFVDTISEVIGPLEGTPRPGSNGSTPEIGYPASPRRSPNPNPTTANSPLPSLPSGSAFSGWGRAAPHSAAAKERNAAAKSPDVGEGTPRAGGEEGRTNSWDWTSFLEGPGNVLPKKPAKEAGFKPKKDDDEWGW